MSKAHKSLVEFTAHPWKSMVLAGLFVCMGAIVALDWIPGSLNRVYFPGHTWVLSGLCGGAAVFFLFCAVYGRASVAGKNSDRNKASH